MHEKKHAAVASFGNLPLNFQIEIFIFILANNIDALRPCLFGRIHVQCAVVCAPFGTDRLFIIAMPAFCTIAVEKQMTSLTFFGCSQLIVFCLRQCGSVHQHQGNHCDAHLLYHIWLVYFLRERIYVTISFTSPSDKAA